jgi:hypothetical protein
MFWKYITILVTICNMDKFKNIYSDKYCNGKSIKNIVFERQ